MDMLIPPKPRKTPVGLSFAPDSLEMYRRLPGLAKEVFGERLDREVSRTEMVEAAIRYFWAALKDGRISYEDFVGEG